MIDILTQKLQSCITQDIWNSDDSANPDLLISPKKDIIIEWTDTGYFEVQEEKVTFNDCNIGHTHCLRKNGALTDWTKFQEWYLESVNTGLFRCDVPITRQEIELDGSTWEYTQWMRPGRGIGAVTNQHFFNVETMPAFLDGIIDIYYNALASAIKVSENTTIPDISVRHILQDNDGYYFAKNFELWDQPPEKVIRMSIGLCQMLIQDIGSQTLSTEFIQDWTARASQKWNSLL